ncbi:thiol peroxidase [Lacticaseibacillus zhaodongensis]|uniref:thiol peroxidase n=1 Tax=Lacticaseibacillus zhaodongensis TaxID=2668065 RepID=UPI0012D3148F|nr:thiol peroxidase [Lacticaseibacillus zhaodongensis]
MEITRHGEAAQTNGVALQLGHEVPAFSLQKADGSTFTQEQLHGEYTLISVVPNINTRVCSISTKRFNQSVDQFKDVQFLTVSTNTNAEQESWCAAEGVKSMQLLSDAKHDFGTAFGLYLADNGTDARSVWIITPDGKVAYRELVQEESDEPDYNSALAYLEAHQHNAAE